MKLAKSDYDRNDFWAILARAKEHGFTATEKTLITFGERVPDEKIIQASNEFAITVVEGNADNVSQLKRARPHWIVIHSLIQDYDFDQNYDICWWYHGPEHLPKADALAAIARMRAHCKMVILSMPHGEYPQGEYLGNPLEKHVSTFYSRDFEEFGENVCVYYETTTGDDHTSIDVFLTGARQDLARDILHASAVCPPTPTNPAKKTSMRLLVFAEGDRPLTKWLKKKATVVTAWPEPRMGADVVYDPQTTTYDGLSKDLPRGFEPDAILLTNLDYHTFLWGLDRAPVPVFATITDSNLCFDAFRCAVPFVDLFLCNERAQTLAIERVGGRARYFPWFAVDTDYFHRHEVTPSWDVVFVGNLHPVIQRRRGKLLEKLLEAQTRFSVRVLSEPDRRKYARALASGRIIFNHTIRSERNLRIFEGLGVGRLMLVEEGNKEIESAFTVGEHFATYSQDSLIETIERYLRDESERERIARSGHLCALSHHSADRRADELLALLNEEIPQGIRRRKVEPQELARRASRVLLHHRRLSSAHELARRAVEREATPEGQAQLIRTLGVLFHADTSGRDKWRAQFCEAMARGLAMSPKSAFHRWNEIEMSQLWRPVTSSELRRFIDDVRGGKLEIDWQANGPVPLGYDRFRVDFEEAIAEESPREVDREGKLRSILLARAFANLAEILQSTGENAEAILASEESLVLREDGYVAERAAERLQKLGQHAEAERFLLRAIDREPFFFSARHALSALQLNSGHPERARKTAESALQTVTDQFRWAEEGFVEILDVACAPPGEIHMELAGSIFFEGSVLGECETARDASLLALELLRRRLPLVLAYGENDPDVERSAGEVIDLFDSSRGPVPQDPYFHLFHGPLHLYRPRDGKVVVVRATCETDRIPTGWVERLAKVDRVWVPSEFHRNAFLESGVAPEKLTVLPGIIGEYPLVKLERLSILEEKRFRFLSVLEWSLRSGWEILLRAYLSEFSSTDDVVLMLRVVPTASESVQIERRDQVRSFVRKELGRDPDRVPEIVFLDEKLYPGELRGLYRAVDAFVLPSRGESFGRPYLEAQLAGLPTIATRWGGQLDYLTDDNAYLIDVEALEEIPDPIADSPGSRWALPSVDHLRTLLRRAYEDPEDGRQRARRAIAGHMARFHARRVANLALEDLNQLSR